MSRSCARLFATRSATVFTELGARCAYGLSWFDAHLWAYAEVNGIEELVSEDFQHGRMYGTVTVRNPFMLHASRA